MRGVTGYRTDSHSPNHSDPGRTIFFRWLARRRLLGQWCSRSLELKSTPDLRTMPDHEFWPWARSRVAAYRKRRQ